MSNLRLTRHDVEPGLSVDDRSAPVERDPKSRCTDTHAPDSELSAHFSRIKRHVLEHPKSLTDDEMLELALHVTMAGRDTRSVARSLLAKYKTLGATIASPVTELVNVHGLEETDVIMLKLLHAVAVNILRAQISVSSVISSFDDLTKYLMVSMGYNRVEHFHILFLDRVGGLIADETQFVGTIDQVAVYPREVIRRCLELHATALILVHNHPTGDPTPSQHDVEITLEIERAGAIMGIVVHDHIVVGRSGFCSLRQEKLI